MATKTQKKPEARRKRLPVPASCMGLMNKAQVGDALGGQCVRTISRMVSSGEFPPPDTILRGKSLWKVATVNAYVARLGEVA